MLKGIPVARKDYLREGRVDHWRGPFREVHSPLLIRTVAGLSQKRIGSVPSMDEEASLNILREARSAFDNGRGEWVALPAGERAERFETFLKAMENAREDIVRLLQWEIGKTARESHNEFDRAVSYARSCLERITEYGQAKGAVIESNGISGRLERTPRGHSPYHGPVQLSAF